MAFILEKSLWRNLYSFMKRLPTPLRLPSRITKWMGADPERFSMKTDPVDNAVVFMIITQYYGREEFEIDGQKRSAHKFGEIDLVEGRMPED